MMYFEHKNQFANHFQRDFAIELYPTRKLTEKSYKSSALINLAKIIIFNLCVFGMIG